MTSHLQPGRCHEEVGLGIYPLVLEPPERITHLMPGGYIPRLVYQRLVRNGVCSRKSYRASSVTSRWPVSSSPATPIIRSSDLRSLPSSCCTCLWRTRNKKEESRKHIVRNSQRPTARKHRETVGPALTPSAATRNNHPSPNGRCWTGGHSLAAVYGLVTPLVSPLTSMFLSSSWR